MGSWNTTYEIIGWSARKLKAGKPVDAKWVMNDYDEMCITRAGKRELIGDVSDELETKAPPSYAPEGEATDVFTPTEDVLLLAPTGFVGESNSALYAGGIHADVEDIGLEDTFGTKDWQALAELAWPLVDASKDGEASFGTLWTFSSGWSDSTWNGPAEFDSEMNLVGPINFAALGAWYCTNKTALGSWKPRRNA